MWYGEGLADIPDELNGYPAQYYAASAYAAEAGGKSTFPPQSKKPHYCRKLNRYLDGFPLYGYGRALYTDNYIGKMVAAERIYAVFLQDQYSGPHPSW